ncbi:MAG: serine protease [Candidatus Obscuribacterales bacterium]
MENIGSIMPDCKKIGQYTAEAALESSDCPSNLTTVWNEELSSAWKKEKSNIVAVSGQMEAGGGVVLNRAMLPHLAISNGESLVLTAAHLVDKKKSILVGTYDSDGEMGDMDQAKLVALDRTKDLALLRVSLSEKPRADGINYQDLGEAKPGKKALAVLTDDTTRSLGFFEVSASSSYGAVGGEAIRKQYPVVTMADDTNIVVFTTPDAPGTSGSPVVSEEGKILGLVSQRLPKIESNKVWLDNESKPLWQQTAAVSSREIRAFLQDVDTCKVIRSGLKKNRKAWPLNLR